MRNGSQIVIAIPHEKFEKILAALVKNYIDTPSSHHQRVFTRYQLIKTIQKNGFEIERVSYQKWPMFIVTVLLALFSKLFTRISMEGQSGVFTVGSKSYLKQRMVLSILILLYGALQLINNIFPVINRWIPWEVEVIARKKG
jgi:hypothetical protein